MLDGNLSAVIDIIRRVGGVEIVQPDEDFYNAGVTSVNALPLLLEIEDQFQIAIPDDRFIQARTPRALHEMILELQTN
jgi:acyl carrier protein